MKRTLRSIWISLGVLVSAALAQQPASVPITVDCNKGQSLNQALARLDRHRSYTVSVNGSCTEYVQVVGFQNLVLKGLSGATLLQPTTSAGSIFNSLLYIESSHSVQVEGFTIQADSGTVPAVGVGHGSNDIRLRYLNVQGGNGGIIVFENSQVSIAYVHAQDSGYSALAIYDSSDVHVEHSLFENTTGDQWHVGIALGASHVTLYGTTIRNMQQGIAGGGDSIVDMVVYNTYYAATGNTDVVIDSPAGTNFDGVSLVGGSLNIYSAKLVINKSGQSWGGTTGGVVLDEGATLNAGSGFLSMAGSLGQGIVVMNNSHATLNGAAISHGGHAGLLAINNSSIDVANSNNLLSTIGGNAVDLFCDSDSKITGTGNIAGSPTAQCTNLLTTETVPLP